MRNCPGLGVTKEAACLWYRNNTVIDLVLAYNVNLSKFNVRAILTSALKNVAKSIHDKHTYQVTLDISGSPIEIHWDPIKYPG